MFELQMPTTKLCVPILPCCNSRNVTVGCFCKEIITKIQNDLLVILMADASRWDDVREEFGL